MELPRMFQRSHSDPHLNVKSRTASNLKRVNKPRYQVINVHATSGTETNYSLRQLFAWVSEILETRITKLQDLITGAVYCQLLDMIFPGYVPLSKVFFIANFEAEYRSNLTLLSRAFVELGITHPVEITLLAKGCCREHLHFLQWLRKFFEVNYAGHEYNPVLKRQGQEFKIGFSNKNTKKCAKSDSKSEMMYFYNYH